MKKRIVTVSLLSLKYIGGQFSESEKRQIDLQKRKDKIVALLNNCYDKKDKENESESEQPEEESEESARTKLRRKLGATKEIDFYPKNKSKQQELSP